MVTDVKEDTKIQTSEWFLELRDSIVEEFLSIEREFSQDRSSPLVNRRKWDRPGGGGGEITVIFGKVFEKVGVNISTVYGKLSPDFAKEIPGALENDGQFWASGISIVAHMQSPLVPAIHMNTRFICTSKHWFGGGMDLTPVYYNEQDYKLFHDSLQKTCDQFDPEYYQKFKQVCDDYFYLKHRNEPRGIGGIFYDYLNSNDWEKDLGFTKEVGKTFKTVYPMIVRNHMYKKWTDEERNTQLVKRGRYVEFNLLYDRGTKFGLMTQGCIDAIMMSMPPLVKWV